MAARDPESVHRLFVERFNANDLEGLMALYEPQATLVPQPGQSVSGAASIREALAGFLALRGTFSMQPRLTVRSDDLALLCSTWTLAGTGPDGSPLDLRATTTDVVRRQQDGSWLVAIDNPWGTSG
ncbi:MAG: SgcJ/EcaC family oxidoreductase [Chloroflexi bacterium]|nr:SgcJ/EcaC family oxidoreductase [Chloroflexota bacterium]